MRKKDLQGCDIKGRKRKVKRKALLKSALAWILALSMAVPNTALTAYAAETGMGTYAEQNGQEQGEENPGGGEAGDGEENPGSGEENPGGGEAGAGEENPGSGEAGAGEENPNGEEAGDGEENPGSGEAGAGEENPGGEEAGAGEENPDGEEAEAGEDTSDKEELTVQETDATGEERFSGIKATWSAYSLVSISNGSSVKFAFSEEDKANLSMWSAAYVELDADGQELETKAITMSQAGYIYGSRLNLRANTRSVKLRVTLTLKSGEKRGYESAPLARPECACAPVFSLEQDGEAGAGSAAFRWDVSGYAAPKGQDKYVDDRFTLKLSCQPDASKEILLYVSQNKTSDNVTLEGLAADTTYQVRAEFYLADEAGEKVFTQTTDPVTIRTKANTVYEFQKIIPDERLRELIAEKINNSGITKDSEKITQSELEKVTYLSDRRSKYADAAVKSLKGIEYLTELDSICLRNYEVSDISDVEWGSLKKLTTLDLEGNNLEAIPSIEDAPRLRDADFRENLLTPAAIDAASATARQLKARGGSVAFEQQRAGGMRLLTEPVYYQVDGKTALAVRIRGIRSNMDNTASFQVDGTEKTFDPYYNDLYLCADSGLTPKEDAYTLTAVVNGESREASFRVEEDQPQVQGEYLDQEWTYASFEVKMTGEPKQVTKAELVDAAGICYGEDLDVNAYSNSYDSRYTTVGEGGSVDMRGAYQIYRYVGGLDAYKNRTPAGSYDLRFTYEDGTTQTFAGAFQVVADGRAYINQIYSTGGYDSSTDQLYFVAWGGNADFSRLDYHVTYAGAERKVSYVSAKRDGKRYIVRLKKEGWTVESQSEVTLEITAKEGYDIDIRSGRTDIWISSGVYYVEWNPVTYALEVAVTQDMEVTSMRVELKNHAKNWKDEGEEFLTGETDQVKQGFASVPMRDAEGRTVSVPREYYRVKIYLNGIEEPAYNQREYLGSDSSGISSGGGVSAYWSGSQYLDQGAKNVEYTYYSTLDYETYKNGSLQMKLINQAETESMDLSPKISYWTSGGRKYVCATVSSTEFCDQEPGQYTLRFYWENWWTAYGLNIMQKGRLYLERQNAVWRDDDTIQISVRTSNTEADKLRLEMWDPQGNKVEGLKIMASNTYSNGYVYLNVTGLRRQESYRRYWIRITHADYGEPNSLYAPDQKYYSDKKGEKETIYGYSVSYISRSNRMVGISYKGWKLPITINAYLPYDTELKSAFTAQTAEDYGSGEYKISFTKAFIDKLEDKDRLYDVTVTDDAGRSTLITGYALGYLGTTSKLTGLTLAPSAVKLAAGETAKLTLGAKPADAPLPSSVSWRSSNETVAKVDAQGVVTGVGCGTATITVTGGGFSAKCSVTVADSVKTPTADPAEGEVEKNTVVHLKSETTGAAIYYTTDGSVPTANSRKYNDNAGITIRRETTIQAIAVKKGYTDSKAATFHYTVPEVTVTFDTDGGTPETAPQTVDKGDYLDPVKIYEPEKDGFRFGGWYTADGDELDVNAPVTASVTYTAKWDEGTQLLKPQANYQDGKELADGARVVLTVPTEAGAAVKDADIYYTLDGSTPTKESSLYEGAILLHKEGAGDETVTVKAFAAGKGYKQSEVSSYTYTLLQDAEGTFGEIEAEDIQDGTVPEGLWIAGLEEGYTYTGSAVKPQIRVYDGKRKLVEKKDYTIAYRNNVNASLPDTKPEKLPVIRLTGKGNYKNEVYEQTFVIEPKNISDSDVTAEDLYVTGNNKEQKKAPVLKWGRKTLSAKKQKDYSVDYGMGDYKTPGRYTITLEGRGNYTGTRTVTETILQAKTEYMMSKVSVTVKDQKLAYTGEALEPEVIVKNGRTELGRDDYEVTYLNNVEVGKATIRVRGLHDYKGVKEASFQITGIPMNKVIVEGMKDKVYTAGIQEYTQTGCQLTYRYKDAQKKVQTRTLTENTDYTVSYRSNTKAGKAEILFTGKGAYTGVLKKSFTIGQCNFNPEVQHAPEVSYCKGGARPEVTVTMNIDGGGSVVLVNGKDYKVTYKNNTKVNDGTGKTKPLIVITGIGNYKGTVTEPFVIREKDIGGLEMSAQDVVYKNKAGNYKTKAVITDTDGKALKEKTDYKLTYYIDGEKVEDNDRLAAPAGTEVTVQAEGQGAYTGTAKTVFRVAEKAFGGVKGAIPEQSYTGSEITLSKDQITLTIGKDKNQETLTEDDYDIVGYKNNIRKGTATVILKGKGKYAGTRNLTFKITARDFKF